MATMTLNLPNKIINFLEKEAKDVIQQIESGKMETYTLDEVVEELSL